MEWDTFTRSAPELDRAMIIDRVIERRLSRNDAADQLGITPRHLGRLIKAYRERGATALISRKRGKRSSVAISEETLRQWMIEADLWQTRQKLAKRAYQPRYRRERYGDLIQIDGSEHYWFEDGDRKHIRLFS